VLAAFALAGLLTACTGTTKPAPAETVVTGTRTVVTTRTVTPPPSRAAITSVAPLPPGAKPADGEVEKSCPYIRTGLQLDPTSKPNMADLEGDRIYRVTRLTDYHPIGCRFYFYAPPYEAVADIRPYTYATAVQARNAMISTAKAGAELITERGFSGKLDGICFRTRYFGPDGKRDWAFAFAKGKRMVVVYTQRDDTSRNALYIAQAIAAKF